MTIFSHYLLEPMRRCLLLLLCAIFGTALWAQYTPLPLDETAKNDTRSNDNSAISYEECMSRALGLLLTTDSLGVAQQYLETALRIAPDAPSHHVVYELLGRIFAARNQPKDAIRACGESLLRKSDYLPALELRAQLHEQQGEWDAAFADYSAALSAVSPAETAILQQLLLARADVAYRQTRWVQAASDLERLLRSEPRNLAANLMLADVHEKMGREEEARVRLSLMVETYPEEVAGWLAHGDFALRHKNFDEAIEAYNTALTLSPQQGEIYARRAAIYERQGRQRAARLDREQARKLGCSETEILSYSIP